MPRRPLSSVIAVVLAGSSTLACGGPPGDLIAIDVSGGPEPRPLRLVVSTDGRASCGDGPLRMLSSELVLEARAVERELVPLAEADRVYGAPGAGGRRRYVARMEGGVVSWTEGAPGLPPPAARATLLARDLERDVC